MHILALLVRLSGLKKEYMNLGGELVGAGRKGIGIWIRSKQVVDVYEVLKNK